MKHALLHRTALIGLLVAAIGPTLNAAETTVWRQAGEVPGKGEGQFVCFSPDGSTLFASFDKTDDPAARLILRAWDAHTLSPKFSFSADDINPSFDRSGNILLTELTQAVVRDGATGKILRSFPHGSVVPRAAISADGSRVVTSTDVLSVWDVKSGARLNQIKSPGGDLEHVRLSATASRLLVVECLNLGERVYHVLDISTGHDLFPPIHPEWDEWMKTSRGFHPVGWSPDVSRLIICGRRWFEIHDAATGALLIRKEEGMIGDIRAIRFTSDGAHVLIMGVYGAEYFDVATGRPSHPRLLIAPDMSDRPDFEPWALSQDASLLALVGSSVHFDHIVDPRIAGIWALRSGKQVLRLNPEDIVGFSFDSTGAQIAVLHRGGRITLWVPESKQ